MRWDKAINKVKDTLGLRDLDKVGQQTPNSIDMNEIDKDIYHDMVDTYDAMSDNLNDGLQEYAPFTNLSEDIYGALYKNKPQLNELEDMTSFTQFNHGIMDSLMADEGFKDLHRSTKFDMLGSAIGTEVLQDAAMKQIMEYKAELTKKKNGEAHDATKASAGEVIDNVNKQGGVQDKIDDLLGGRDAAELSKEEARKLAKYQRQLMDLQDEIEANLDGAQEAADGLKDATKKGIKDAIMDVAEVQDIVSAWGLEAGANGNRISVDKRKAAIERVRRSDRLKKLTDIVGRMKKIAGEKKKKKLPEGHSIDNVEVGNKLESVLPSEMMKLAHPATKKDFYNRYQSGQLLQYKKSDVKKVGQGPVVFCHDKSGSMNPERDDWATALALAMLEIAQKEKRNYAYIPYESSVIGNYVRNIFPGELDPDHIMDIAELSPRGGTNFMAPLDEAVKCLLSDNYKKGDIVFVTDGECGVDQTWLKNFLAIKKEKEFYVNAILINAGGGHVSTATLEQFSDNIVTISNLADLDDSNTKEIFRITDDKDKYADASPDPNAQPSGAV